MTDSIGPATQRAQALSAIKSAAEATGVDFGYLVKTAQRESNFNAAAKAGTSSATGLFQFTSETWLSMLQRYGGQHGVDLNSSRAELLALRNDPDVSARMAAELATENAGILEKKLGRPATQAELYAAHFMGPSEAARLVEAARRNDAGPASDLFPKAAQANANVFRGADGAQLTAAGLYQKLTGAEISLAEAGHQIGSAVSQAVSTIAARAADPTAAVAARLGMAQLTSSLMAALFDLQDEKKV